MGRQGTLPSPLALLHPNRRHRRFHSNSSIHRGGTETESGGNLSKDPELLRAELSEVLGVLTSGPGLVGSGSIQNCFLFCRNVKSSVSEFFPMFSSSSHHAKPWVCGLSVPLPLSVHFIRGCTRRERSPSFPGFSGGNCFSLSAV